MPRPQFLKASLFVGTGVLVVGVFLFTNVMIRRLSDEVASTSRVLAGFCAQASFPVSRDPELQRIFTETIANLDFPIVITDTDSLPRAWRQVGVDQTTVPEEALDSLAAGRLIAPLLRERIERVQVAAFAMDRKNPPIRMFNPGTGQLLGHVHYGEPPALEALRWMPYVSVGGVLMLIGLGLWGLTSIRQAERRSIYVGMARETAHQLGTPLSSLLGWIELLRERATESLGADVSMPKSDFDETLVEMEHDVERLTKVAQRFSHVGSAPSLQLQDVTPIVREAVQYVRRRVPQGEGEVQIRERYDEVPPINLNREVLEWAVENLLTNAVNALDKRPGIVEVAVELRGRTEEVELIVSDNGRGMTQSEQDRAFEPGYTTKRRGWGLGLALARRVVEEYHGGRLFIRRSSPGEGTTVVISFPT